jgi:hypothetical protein
MEPATAMLISSAMQAGGNILGGVLGNPGNQETQIQRKQRHLIDDLLRSLGGGGKYGDIFTTDENTFNKSIRDPMMTSFRNNIAPQIQQSYIAGGQQRGTGLDDQLLRAGIDINSNIDQMLFDYMERGKDRKMNAMNAVLGMGMGAPNAISSGQAGMRGLGGYLNSDAFTNQVNQGFKPYTQPQNQPQTLSRGGGRNGFELPLNQWGTAT